MRYSKELLKGGTPLLVMSVLDGKDSVSYTHLTLPTT